MKIIYYQDELNDEFSDVVIEPKTIDGSYDYLRNGSFHRILHVFFYRIIAEPLAWVFLKLKYGHRIVNRKLLRKCKGQGVFLYGNHTNAAADALIPSMISFPVAASVIVHPNNVSMPLLGRITPYLGALPLPDDKSAARNFMNAVSTVIARNKTVVVYPEAHIWPYYTDIRSYGDASFRYPVRLGAPVFAFTNTYQKRRFRKTPRIVTYVDGPFYPQAGLPAKENRAELREKVYAAMKMRAKENNVVLIKYVKKEREYD